jgi:hypothetical protein
MRGIADELKKRKVPTPRGGTWHPQLVKRVSGVKVVVARRGRRSEGYAHCIIPTAYSVNGICW